MDGLEIRVVGTAPKADEVEAHLRVRNAAVPAHGDISAHVAVLLRKARLPTVTLLGVADGDIVGTAWSDEGYLHQLGVAVLPSVRRRGIGAALASAITEMVPDHVDRASVVADVADPASVRFAETRGCVLRDPAQNHSVVVTLDAATLDRAQSEVAAAPASVRPTLGSQHVDDSDDSFWDSLTSLMQSRPEADQWDELTASSLRSDEQERNRGGGFTVTLIDGGEVVAAASGDVVTWTDWFMSEHTTVRPSHQGRGLSRLVKAHQHLLAAERGSRYITTIIDPSRDRMVRTARRLGYVRGGTDWMEWRRSAGVVESGGTSDLM